MSQVFHSPTGFSLSSAVWALIKGAAPGALVSGSAKVAPAIGSKSLTKDVAGVPFAHRFFAILGGVGFDQRSGAGSACERLGKGGAGHWEQVADKGCRRCSIRPPVFRYPRRCGL